MPFAQMASKDQNLLKFGVNSNDFLEITFDDGVHTKLAIQNILKEFSNINDVKYISKIKWDSSLKDFNNFEFKDNFFEENYSLLNL